MGIFVNVFDSHLSGKNDEGHGGWTLQRFSEWTKSVIHPFITRAKVVFRNKSASLTPNSGHDHKFDLTT